MTQKWLKMIQNDPKPTCKDSLNPPHVFSACGKMNSRAVDVKQAQDCSTAPAGIPGQEPQSSDFSELLSFWIIYLQQGSKGNI